MVWVGSWLVIAVGEGSICEELGGMGLGGGEKGGRRNCYELWESNGRGAEGDVSLQLSDSRSACEHARPWAW